MVHLETNQAGISLLLFLLLFVVLHYLYMECN
jgi:hypothetical protein